MLFVFYHVCGIFRGLREFRNSKYIGSSTDLERRLKQHSSGHTHSTKRLGDMKLVFYQEYKFLKEARSIELKLKKLKRKDYIANIIQEGFIKIKP